MRYFDPQMSSKNKFDLFEWLYQKNYRWLLHVIFWLAVLVFYTFFFGYKSVDYKITFSFVIILLPVTMVTTYFLNYELIPNYLFKKRYGKFLLYFIYTLIVSFYIEMVTVMGIFIMVAELNIKEFHPANTNALILIAGMYVIVFLGAAVKLVNHYNQNQAQIQTLKKDKVEAELKFLKSQLHPHFLFNTLNNLYSLTLEKSDKAPDVVLKLSGLLDYILYECDADFVPLKKELNQLENYIELEKLRYGKRLSVTFDNNVNDLDQKVPPMLFMTLLENGFKHGVSKSVSDSWIKMKLLENSSFLKLEMENSVEKSQNEKLEKAGGIGLENLRNRLQLLFKEEYELKVEERKDSFFAYLKLPIIREG